MNTVENKIENMKTRVKIGGLQEDGGVERAEANLKEGNDVIIENFDYELRAELCKNLGERMGFNVGFSKDFSECHFVRKPH
jgi:hypothetical protein